MVTPVLNITHISVGQSQKETTANDAFDDLSLSVAGLLRIQFSANDDYTLDVTASVEQQRYNLLQFHDSALVLTANRTIFVPSATNRWLIENETDYRLTVRTNAGKPGTGVGQGERRRVYCNGSACIEGMSNAFEMAFHVIGKPQAGGTLVNIPMIREVTFPSAMGGALGKSEIAANATSIFHLYKNGTAFASATIAPSDNSAVFAGTETAFVFGDVFKLDAPSPQDASLADIGFTLRALKD